MHGRDAARIKDEKLRRRIAEKHPQRARPFGNLRNNLRADCSFRFRGFRGITNQRLVRRGFFGESRSRERPKEPRLFSRELEFEFEIPWPFVWRRTNSNGRNILSLFTDFTGRKLPMPVYCIS